MSSSVTLTSDATLDAAFDWLCKRRLGYYASAAAGGYTKFDRKRKPDFNSLPRRALPVRRIKPVEMANGEESDLWLARDALMLKAMSQRMPAKQARFQSDLAGNVEREAQKATTMDCGRGSDAR